MSQKQVRWLVGSMGGLWGLCVGFAASVWLTLFVTGGNPFLLVALAVLVPLGSIGGIVFGVLSTLRFFPLPKSKQNPYWTGRAVFVYVGIPLIVAGLFYSPLNPLVVPSDNAIITRFERNEKALNELVRVIKHDKRANVADGRWMSTDAAQAATNHARAEKFDALLHQAGVKNDFSVGSNWEKVEFPVWSVGLAVTSSEIKGFVYLKDPPEKTHKTLDNGGDAASYEMAYRHIKGNWYVFYQYDPELRD